MRPNVKVVGISLVLSVALSLLVGLLVGIAVPAWIAGFSTSTSGLALGALWLFLFCAFQTALAKDT